MLTASWRALLPIAALALAGCAAMNRQECEVSDWRSVGFEDRARGTTVARIADYRKACAKHHVAPDLDAYRAGYAEGVETFCREANGFSVGSRGASYEGVCPSELEVQFLGGYRTGRHLYELNASVDEVAGKISSRRHALRENKERLVAKQAALLDKNTPDNERVALAAEIYELGKRQGAIESELAALQRELGARQEERDRFRESVAYHY